MEIRFKFRSSSTFDTIDIGQQSSISIRDLKSKIVSKKHLNLCHDFDLVFSDSISGIEFTDENTRIPSGSSVIIKRVPAKSSPSLREFDVLAGHFGSGDANDVNAVEPPVLDFGVNDCDDFGVDLCPPPVANTLDHKKLPSNINEKKDPLPRRAAVVNNIAVETFNMPLELKCSLCTTYFKEAVMIPCCQHSFCEKCIRLALVQDSRCPMCTSTKCKPDDLLPNISLRQAIKRFLESEHQHNVLESNLDRYAPDGESGIQVRQLSYAPTVRPRDLQLNRCAAKVSDKLLGNTKCDPVALDNCTEYQGENEPLKTAGANEEASNSFTKKGEDFRVGTGGGERNFITPGRLNKGLRTCYKCGSPDHLIRECPAAAGSHTSSWCGTVPFQGGFPGYAPQYWPGNPPPARPLYDMYCGPEMMMYNTNMAAATPFALSPYTSAMFTGYPVNSGPLELGGMGFVSGINAHQMNQTDLPGLMGCAKQRGNHSEAFERGEVFDRDHNVNRQLDKAERGPNNSGDSFTRRSDRNYRSHERSDDDYKYSNGKRQEKISRSSEGGRNCRNVQLVRPTTDKVVPDSRIRPPVERHENIYRSSKRNEDMREKHDSGSSQIHHHSNKESIQRRKEHERRSGREFYSHSGSGLEPSYSSGDGRRRRDESGSRSRHSKTNSKPNGKDTYHEPGRVIKYSDDDYGEDYQSHKRRKYH